MIPFPTGTAC